MLGHKMSEFVYKVHWGIHAVVFAKQRDNLAEAFCLFECGEELTNKQKRWVQICQANLQIEARQEAHKLAEEERTNEQKQMVTKD